MKHSMIKTMIALPVIGAVLMVLVAASPTAKVRFPKGYIAMWESQTSDAIATVLNTETITRITPKFNEEALLTRRPDDAEYLEVRFSDGQVIQVFEPLDEFLNRIRSSQ